MNVDAQVAVLSWGLAWIFSFLRPWQSSSGVNKYPMCSYCIEHWWHLENRRISTPFTCKAPDSWHSLNGRCHTAGDSCFVCSWTTVLMILLASTPLLFLVVSKAPERFQRVSSTGWALFFHHRSPLFTKSLCCKVRNIFVHFIDFERTIALQ